MGLILQQIPKKKGQKFHPQKNQKILPLFRLLRRNTILCKNLLLRRLLLPLQSRLLPHKVTPPNTLLHIFFPIQNIEILILLLILLFALLLHPLRDHYRLHFVDHFFIFVFRNPFNHQVEIIGMYPIVDDTLHNFGVEAEGFEPLVELEP